MIIDESTVEPFNKYCSEGLKPSLKAYLKTNTYAILLFISVRVLHQHQGQEKVML